MKPRMFSLLFVCTFAFLTAFTASAQAQCVAPPTGMTNWWTGDGNAFDIIGGQHGSLQGGAAFDAGKVAKAFSLNGTNGYVLVPHNPTAGFNFAGSFTIDAWIYLKSEPTEFAPIVSKWNDINVNKRSYFIAVQKYNGGLARAL